MTATCDALCLGARLIVRPALSQRASGQTMTKIQHSTDAAATPICRILVVDDNRDAAHTMARLLIVLGLEVVEAHSGEEAISVVEATTPDLVLLDLGMAGMDGYETARQIQARFSNTPIPVIALTGLGQEQDRARTRDSGFAAHLVKPVDLALLEQTLAAFLPSFRRPVHG